MRFSLAALTTAAVIVGLSSSAAAQDLSGELKDVNWIGFQQLADASRVFIRTTEKAEFTVDTSQPNMVVILLANARIPLRNNRRPLNTSFFDSPVRYIQTKTIEGPSASVRVEILMRNKVPFEQVQNDNVLSLFFRRTQN